MSNPFKDPDDKNLDERDEHYECHPVTKKDLRKMEQRLTDILLVIASGDKDRITILTERLKNSATALQDAVDKNKP